MSQNESTTFLVTDAKNLTLIDATRENSPWCNPLGFCSFTPCSKYNIVESPEHVLLCCPSYDETREYLLQLCQSLPNQVSADIITTVLSTYSTRDIMQLILDPSVIPIVIRSAQIHDTQVYNDLFYIGRTWCFSIHRERLKRLNRWNFR